MAELKPEDDSRRYAGTPSGMYSARCDEKGRVRLPRDVERYFLALRDQTLFITSFDGQIIRVYPRDIWEANLEVLRNSQNPEAAERLGFLADVWGAASEVDREGRILLQPDLRRDLKLENQTVYLRFNKHVLEIYGQETRDRMVAEALAKMPEDLQALKREGLR